MRRRPPRAAAPRTPEARLSEAISRARVTPAPRARAASTAPPARASIHSPLLRFAASCCTPRGRDARKIAVRLLSCDGCSTPSVRTPLCASRSRAPAFQHVSHLRAGAFFRAYAAGTESCVAVDRQLVPPQRVAAFSRGISRRQSAASFSSLRATCHSCNDAGKFT